MLGRGFGISAHARRRCQQRGIPFSLLQAVLEEADRITPVGSGAVAMHVGKHSRRTLVANGMSAGMADRIGRILVVVADGEVVTAMHERGRRGRRYRRGRAR